MVPNSENMTSPKVSPEAQFAQKLASNTKSTRDKAVKRLKKWVMARSSSVHTHFTEEDILKLWKGLFYCMWMSDKPVIQEELAKTISEIIHCFNNTEPAFLFIKDFFQTMMREWARIDYLRVDKYMMFVRLFLNHSFEFVRKLKWESTAVARLIAILNDCVINPQSEEVSVGLQMHVADIYIEELAKVASDELSGKQLTTFLVPYCHLLAVSKNSALRKTVIKRVFEFTMRLSDFDSGDESETDTVDGADPSVGKVDKDQAAPQESEDEEEMMDDEDDHLNEVYGEYKGEDKFLKQVRKHERESMKLPFPDFDYKDIGDTLLETAGTVTTKCNQKMRNQNYNLVKRFHEMASGIFPLDAINPSLGRRLRTRDFDAAAQRLLEHSEEIAEEKHEWREQLKLERKRKLHGEENDEIDEASDAVVEKTSVPQLSDLQENQRRRMKNDQTEKLGAPGRKNRGKIVSGFVENSQDEASSPITQPSRKKRRLDDAKKAPIAAQRQPAISHPDHVDRLAARLLLKSKKSDVSTTGITAEAKIERTIARRNKRKKRALKAKAEKLARKSKDSTLDNGITNQAELESDKVTAEARVTPPKAVAEIPSGRNLSRKQTIAARDKLTPKSRLTKSGSRADSSPEFEAQTPNSKAVPGEKMPSRKKKTPESKLATPKPRTTESEPAEPATKNLTPEPKSGTTKFNVYESKQTQPGAKKFAAELSVVTPESKVLATTESAKMGSKNATPEPKMATPKSTKARPKSVKLTTVDVTPESKVAVRTVEKPTPKSKSPELASEPQVQKSPNDEITPSPKRKVDFVTLWTPAAAETKANEKTAPRRSTRTPSKIPEANPKASATKKSKLERYYDKIDAMDIDEDFGTFEKIDVNTKEKKVKHSPKTSPFVQFEDFVKTPPAFFRTAIKKVTPEKTPKGKGIATMEDSTKSSRKVNFSLKKNSVQGPREYAMSLRSRPGIPFDASQQPAQGVLKPSPTVTATTPRNRMKTK